MFGGTAWLVSSVPGIFLPAFYSCCHLNKRLLRVYTPFSHTGFILLLPPFLLMFRVLKVKIEVNEKIEVRLVLLVLDYLLAMSRSEFAKWGTLYDMGMV